MKNSNEDFKNTLDELEESLKKTEKKKKNSSNPKNDSLKFKIVDLEKENEMIQNHLEQITVSLNSQAESRKDLLREVNENIDMYSNKLVEYENKINNLELQEIKYKNQERELEDYIEMYNNKCEEYNNEVDKLNKEIITLRKKIKGNETVLSSLRSVVTLLIKEYGIDRISEITGIENDNIEKYLQE